MFDVAVIGGGVIGGTVLRELTRYRLSVCLLEKEGDVSMGQSRANSGIVHAGFDAKEGSLKAKFNVLGNRMMEEYCRELGVKYEKNGSLVVAFTEDDLQMLELLYRRGLSNGVEEMELLDREALLALEPHISQRAKGALYAKSAGIVCPYGLTIAAIGNAMDNGASLYTDFAVCGISGKKGGFLLQSADGRRIEASVIINCAGLGGGEICALVGDGDITVGGRRGEYLLLDRESGDFVKRTLFFTPTEKGKGILVTPTVDKNLLLGPTSEEIPDGSTDTTEGGLAFVRKKVAEMVDEPPLYNVITSFSGVRAYNNRHDFIIEESSATPGVIHCVGIESPGLTSAPAIARYVAEELVGRLLPLEKNPDFCGKRESESFFWDLSDEEKNALIKKEPAYGRIVCRCEGVSEGEILRALRENPPARDVDGIKRRTRGGMGRCQGGFCQPQIVELIARERGIPLEEVTKFGGNSRLLVGVSK